MPGLGGADLGVARRWLRWLLAAEMVVLVATGVYLALRYQPTAADAWNDLDEVRRRLTLGDRIRALHRWSSWALLATALLAAAVEAVARVGGRRIALGLGAVVLAVAAHVTGTLLAWDQIALWSVTIGNDVSGLRPLLDDGALVRFFLVDGFEVSLAEMRWRAAAHLAATLLLAAALAPIWRRGARDRAPGA